MNNIATHERNTDNTAQIKKIINTVKKVLMYTGIAVGSILLLGLLYQILQYLFVGAILLVAWLCPGKWW